MNLSYLLKNDDSFDILAKILAQLNFVFGRGGNFISSEVVIMHLSVCYYILLHSFVYNQSQSVEENGPKEVGPRSHISNTTAAEYERRRMAGEGRIYDWQYRFG